MPEVEQFTDLTSHHIEGYAVHGGARFKVPLISHIEGNLWTGGCIHGVPLPEDFEHVISLYPWERYRIGPDTHRTEYRLYDSTDELDRDLILEIAGVAARSIQEGKTLVHCQAGLNRSGLIAGLALVLGGKSPDEAVALLREKRCPAVLCNPMFEEWLLAFVAEEAS